LWENFLGNLELNLKYVLEAAQIEARMTQQLNSLGATTTNFQEQGDKEAATC